jgi:hypothetical protein
VWRELRVFDQIYPLLRCEQVEAADTLGLALHVDQANGIALHGEVAPLDRALEYAVDECLHVLLRLLAGIPGWFALDDNALHCPACGWKSLVVVDPTFYAHHVRPHDVDAAIPPLCLEPLEVGAVRVARTHPGWHLVLGVTIAQAGDRDAGHALVYLVPYLRGALGGGGFGWVLLNGSDALGLLNSCSGV